jgi:hypothetical protein
MADYFLLLAGSPGTGAANAILQSPEKEHSG